MRNKVCLGYKCALPSPASRNHSANSCIQGHFSAISRAESGYKAQTEEQAKRPWGTQEVLHLVMGGDNYKERGASWRRWHLRCTWAAASGKGHRAGLERLMASDGAHTSAYVRRLHGPLKSGT